jgi:hypothetical protein
MISDHNLKSSYYTYTLIVKQSKAFIEKVILL